MNMRLTKDNRGGSVVVTALIMIAVAMIGAASAARFCLHELGLSSHSSARVQALHTAEAGIEVAIHEFNRELGGGSSWSGWTAVSSEEFSVSRALDRMPVAPSTPSSFAVTAETDTLTITSVGQIWLSRFEDPVERTVRVTLETDEVPFRSPFEWGLLARDRLNIVGTPFCISYDSRNGPFGGANVSSRCNIGSAGLRPDAITGGGATQVFGDAAIMPGAGVSVAPGPFWTGTLKNDLEVDFPEVVVPRTDMTMGAINGNTTINVVGDTYAGTPQINLSGPRTLTIAGNGELTLYVAGGMDVGTPASITYAPSAGGTVRVQMFINGNVDIKGELNTDGIPEHLQIYGTANCLTVDCQANNNKSLTIYAPEAQINLAGNATIQGAIVGGNIKMTGTFDFRYDEALSALSLPVEPQLPEAYRVLSWVEL